VNSPKVEVETEAAGRYDDVDLETLHRLVSQLSPDNSYLILHRSDKPEEFAWASIQRSRDTKLTKGYIVQFKDQSGEWFQAKVTDLDRVRAALSGWAFDLVGWREDLKWKPLKRNKVVNLSGSFKVSESQGVWTAHFPALDLSATGPTEEEAREELRTVILVTVNLDAEKRRVFADWRAKNKIEVSPEELERMKQRMKQRKPSPAQEQRIRESSAEFMASRPAERKRR